MTDPQVGTLRVTSASYPPTGVSARYSNYRLAGVVQAERLPPTAVEHAGIAAVAKWPQPGTDLPVTVDRVLPDRIVIHWDQIPRSGDVALAAAQAEATRMRTGLDPAVLAEAVAQAAAGNSPDWVAPPPGSPRDELPPSTATIGVTGRVAAASMVGVPAALAPGGGVVDLTVAVRGPNGAERNEVCRASFDTVAERDRAATVGAVVRLLIDPDNPDAVTLASG
jgi:hypothetical protein